MSDGAEDGLVNFSEEEYSTVVVSRLQTELLHSYGLGFLSTPLWWAIVTSIARTSRSPRTGFRTIRRQMSSYQSALQRLATSVPLIESSSLSEISQLFLVASTSSAGRHPVRQGKGELWPIVPGVARLGM